MKITIEEIWFNDDEMIKGDPSRGDFYCWAFTHLDKQYSVEKVADLAFVPPFHIGEGGNALPRRKEKDKVNDLSFENYKTNLYDCISNYKKSGVNDDAFIYVARQFSDRSVIGMIASSLKLRKLTPQEIEVIKKFYI